MEFLNEFQKAVNDVTTHMITKVMEEPQGSQHSKQLYEKKAMPSSKTINTTISQGKTVLLRIKHKKWTS